MWLGCEGVVVSVVEMLWYGDSVVMRVLEWRQDCDECGREVALRQCCGECGGYVVVS